MSFIQINAVPKESFNIVKWGWETQIYAMIFFSIFFEYF